MSRVEVFEAAKIASEDWRDLQSLQRDAFAAAMPDVPREQIEALVNWEEPMEFAASHAHPNSEVGKLFNDGQSFADPLVAVAIEADSPIGWAYAASNVSGANPVERWIKSQIPGKNYFWLREFAVDPGHWWQGVAKDMGKSLLQRAMPSQPPTAYIWPDRLPLVDNVLRHFGFEPTGEQMVDLFKVGTQDERQVRMQAASARSVLGKLVA